MGRSVGFYSRSKVLRGHRSVDFLLVEMMPVMDHAIDVSSTMIMMDVSRRIYSGGCGSVSKNHSCLHKKRIGELCACVLLNQRVLRAVESALCCVLRAADSLCLEGLQCRLQCRFGRHLQNRSLSSLSTFTRGAVNVGRGSTRRLKSLQSATVRHPAFVISLPLHRSSLRVHLDGSTCDTRTR